MKSAISPGLLLVCLVASIGGLLFGFDTAVISGTVQPVVAQFGLTSLLEGWFTSSALLGCIMGAPVGGVLGDRLGRKPPLLLSAVFFFISAFYSMVPDSFAVLIWARWIGGVGVGIASVVAPMYIAEFAPPRWRGRLVTFYQLAIVSGILLAYYSNWMIGRFAADPPGFISAHPRLERFAVRESWRAMFGAECVPAAVFFLLLWIVPESPRWLVQVGQRRRALGVLRWINRGRSARCELRELQKGITQDPGSWTDLLLPAVRRPLLVGVLLSVFGQFSGVNIMVYYGPKVLGAAGFESMGALLGQVGFGLINLTFTFIALTLIDRWGRRPLLVVGMSVVTATLALVGALFYLGGGPAASRSAGTFPAVLGIWIGALICVYMACIALSICAVIWVIIPEIFPNRIRGRGTAAATFANWTSNTLSALFFPWYVEMFGMHAFFTTTALICLAATFFFWRFVPETKGRSLEEIESSWLRDDRGSGTADGATRPG